MQDTVEALSTYDVLVEPPILGVSTEYTLAKPNDHVGNQRFRVLLNMRQLTFGEAYKRQDNDECHRIVDELVDTVCNHVVPRGRFLVQRNMVNSSDTPNMTWEIMDDSLLKSMLHKILRRTEISSTAFLNSCPDEISSFMFDEDEGAAPRENSNGSSRAAFVFPAPLIPMNIDMGHKRRRRSSLLRRSNSETMMEMVLDNRKKLHLNVNDLRGGIKEEPTSWKSSSPAGHLNRMDVVLTPSCNALDPSCITVGNNRLHILSAVRSGQFRSGTLDEQEKILDEMIETVCTFWKGRFLLETEGGGYDEVSKPDAREAMRMILEYASTVNQEANLLEKKYESNFDATGRKTDFGLMNASIVSEVGTEGLMVPGRSRIPFPKQMQVHFNATLPSVLVEDAHKNQNRALMDLKKQKTRNQNASRLMEKLGVKKKNESLAQSTDSSAEIPLFPIGGMVQPSLVGTGRSAGRKNWLASLNVTTSAPSPFNPSRESTVFSKVDMRAMEKLDCTDNFDEAQSFLFPDSNSSGNVFNGEGATGLYYPNNG